MEDIDAANSDVLTTIKSLIETKSIAEQRISPDFRLFLTQRFVFDSILWSMRTIVCFFQ